MKTIAVCGYKISQSTVYARLKTTFIAKFKFIIFSIAYIKSKVVQSADIGEIIFFFKEFGFGYPTARTDNKSHPTLFSIVKGTFGT